MIQTPAPLVINSDADGVPVRIIVKSGDVIVPCRDSSSECVQILTARALNASPEIKVLDEAIKLNRTKLWTNYLSANALNPLSLALQVARNIAGGGDVAQAKLTTNQLRATRAALEQTMRANITQSLTDYETAARTEANTRAGLEAHEQRLSILLVSYRLGDSTTEAVLPEFAASESLRAQITSAQAAENAALVRCREIVAPSNTPQPKKP